MNLELDFRATWSRRWEELERKGGKSRRERERSDGRWRKNRGGERTGGVREPCPVCLFLIVPLLQYIASDGD